MPMETIWVAGGESAALVLGMMACAAAGAAVISKSAGAMFSNEGMPADEALLKKGSGGRAVEKVDVSSKTTTASAAAATASPPSDASSSASPPS